MQRIFLFLFLFSFCGSSLHAQRPSSLEKQYSHQFTYQNDDRYYFIDTNFHSLHYYRQWNNAYRDLFGTVPLTNLGGARNNLTFNYNRNIWQNFDFGPYDAYFLNRETIPYYSVKTALSDAKFWSGYDRGQVFDFLHTQNINPHWNFLGKIRRLNSLGLYTHNQNVQTELLFNTHYHNPAKGYEAYAYYVFNDYDLEEFGGLANDSDYVNNVESNRALVDVGLRNNDGEADLRRMRNVEYFIDQKARIFAFGSTADSTKKAKPKASGIFVGHTTAYQNMSLQYVGDASGNTLYDNLYYSNGDFQDTVHYRDFENTFYLQTEVGQVSKLTLKGGVKYLFTEYSGADFSFSNQNFGLVSNLKGKIKDWLNIDASGDIIATGPYSGALDIKGKGSMKVWKEVKLSLDYQLQTVQPDVFSQFYRSNNFIWDNTYDLTTLNHIEYGLSWGAENFVKVANDFLGEYVYYNAEGLPQQTNENVGYSSLKFQQNFDWVWFHFDNRITYQVATSGAEFYPLPDVVTRNSVYAHYAMFEKALLGIIGLELNYFTEYNSLSYNSATGRFFVDDSAPLVGNYPVLDFFAQFKVKKGKFFFKYEHVNQGLFGYNAFAAPHYPIPDRVFRVGLSWRFFE